MGRSPSLFQRIPFPKLSSRNSWFPSRSNPSTSSTVCGSPSSCQRNRSSWNSVIVTVRPPVEAEADFRRPAVRPHAVVGGSHRLVGRPPPAVIRPLNGLVLLPLQHGHTVALPEQPVPSLCLYHRAIPAVPPEIVSAPPGCPAYTRFGTARNASPARRPARRCRLSDTPRSGTAASVAPPLSAPD